jgi:hypothetical protein
MKMHTPEDWKLSPHTGYTRGHWEEVFVELMRGCLKYASPNKSMIKYPGGHPSFYDERTDGLEGFARMLWMAGAYLHHRTDGNLKIDGKKLDLADYCKGGILVGTNAKAGDEYWGDIRTRHQTIVEAAAVSVFLFLTRRLVWDRMDAKEQDQVAGWLKQIIEKEPYVDNWVLFKVVVNATLKSFGREYSQLEIDQYLHYMLTYYAGDGWYSDGPGPCFEYYNAWTIHPYFLFWTMMDGQSKPELVDLLRMRTHQFLETYKYFFAGNGVHPAFGRSAIYRMATVSIFPIAEFFGVSPISPGQARRVCSGNLKYFIEKGAIEDHHFTMGFNARYLPLPETYSSAQSPYWGAKAWWTFLLKEDHPFWTNAEEPSEIERRSYIVPIPGAGFILQGDKPTGHVMVYVQNSSNWVRKKYANFAYSSHFGFEITFVNDTYNYEGGISASEDGKHFVTRLYPHHIATQDHFSASWHAPFKLDENKPPHGNLDPSNRIYSSLILKDDYHIRIHKVVAKKNFMVFDGGLPLGYDSGQPVIQSGKGWEYAKHGKRVSFIQNLHGFNGQIPAEGFQGNREGNNVLNKFSVVPALKYKGKSIDGQMFASLVVVNMKGSTPEELNGLVKTFELVEENLCHIVFHDGEEIYTQVGEFRDVFLTLKGKKLNGRILFARADTDGRFHVVYHDGRLAEF